MPEIIYPDESYEIQGAIFEVYRLIGSGFLEGVYQECLEYEFSLRNIPFLSQSPITLRYKGHELEKKYIPDFICHNKIIVEIKAINQLAGEHRSRILNYLKATGFRLGLLVNFGVTPKVDIERFVI